MKNVYTNNHTNVILFCTLMLKKILGLTGKTNKNERIKSNCMHFFNVLHDKSIEISMILRYD